MKFSSKNRRIVNNICVFEESHLERRDVFIRYWSQTSGRSKNTMLFRFGNEKNIQGTFAFAQKVLERRRNNDIREITVDESIVGQAHVSSRKIWNYIVNLLLFVQYFSIFCAKHDVHATLIQIYLIFNYAKLSAKSGLKFNNSPHYLLVGRRNSHRISIITNKWHFSQNFTHLASDWRFQDRGWQYRRGNFQLRRNVIESFVLISNDIGQWTIICIYVWSQSLE